MSKVLNKNSSKVSYRISGHESFTCRYAWLPKIIRLLKRDSKLFHNDDACMVEMGLGKNMVRSVRFWANAIGIIKIARNEVLITDFGDILLGQLDPYLEDVRTLWLIHWKLSSDVDNPLLAWDFLLNSWHAPDIVPSKVCKILREEVGKQGTSPSSVTIEQHFETFIHTYFPTRGRKGDVQEDNLDCPLVELELILKLGEQESNQFLGKRETIYGFRRDSKPDITSELFLYCLNDFWQKRHKNEATLSFREVAHGHGSPGQIFKLPEEDVRERLNSLTHQSKGLFVFSESSNLQQINKTREVDSLELLKDIYHEEMLHVGK